MLVAFFFDPERSRLSSVDEEIAPSLTEMATRIRCQNWDSIRSQSMTFLLGSPNSASMCTVVSLTSEVFFSRPSICAHTRPPTHPETRATPRPGLRW
ncbi:MAG: hypothetical protein K0R62_5141 [Nonomuraea muscovyensis]|nr:hypothetical protein [Nonomuraea muscovyensis]